jgi:parvulin-like peptidyl-prolyl isomerase
VRRIVTLVILSAVLTGCGGGEQPAATSQINTVPQSTSQPQPTQQTSPETQEAAVQSNPDGVVAEVNGVGIPREAYERELARRQQSGAVADVDALGQTVLDWLIEQQVIEQAAAALGVTVSDAEIDADIQAMSVQAGSPEAWAQWKADNLYTDEEYRDAIRSQLITLRVRDAVVAQGSANPEANTVQQVHARHILVATEVEAQNVLQRLQNGEPFEALAAELSRDVTTRDRGGDLGFFIAENLTTPELAEVAFGLQPGEVAGPISTNLGYHIIQTIEFANLSTSPEDQALQQEAIFNSWLQDALASAQVERFLN